jgi:O-6-methylguanine DNA methyltransferase
MNVEIVKTKIGLLKILSVNGLIMEAFFLESKEKISNQNDLTFIYDVNDYFDGVTFDFSSKYKLIGTPFQIKVWKEISKIPYGCTKTYTEIAKAIGCPNACRAVANACGQNKIVLFIPCHRVIGKNSIGGYKFGIERKKWLLKFEKCNKQD